MNLFERLIAEQNRSLIKKGRDRLYFDRNSQRLSSIEIYRRFLDSSAPYMVMRSNVLLHSLENKETIEKAYLGHEKAAKNGGAVLSLDEYMDAVRSELPYLALPSGEKNYVPIIPETISLLYTRDPARLFQKPYKALLSSYEAILIDPFDTYGSGLFESHFTSLIPILRHGEFLASFDNDENRLYFINGEGRLEGEVAIFDKRLENPGKTHIAERLRKVAERYFAFDREGMLDALLEERLISASLIREIELRGLEGK